MSGVHQALGRLRVRPMKRETFKRLLIWGAMAFYWIVSLAIIYFVTVTR